MNTAAQHVSVIIPSLNPDSRLLDVVRSMRDAGFHRILLVDDGSGKEYAHFFAEALALCENCVLLRHHKNLGKGRALKTSFNFFLEHQEKDIGVVTVDADHQHTAQDALACAAKLAEFPDHLVLGVRDFSGQDVPKRSMLGNRITAGCFRFLCGISVSDTQTGLRAIPAAFMKDILGLDGERFEFETNMLLETKKKNVQIAEVPIRTIYIDENASSHFRPFHDSLKIFALIFKFLFSSMLSTLCDLILFAVLAHLFRFLSAKYRLLIATAGARALSAILNYRLNKTFVFESSDPAKHSAFRYFLLCVLQMGASYGGVYLLHVVCKIPSVLSKIIVDTLLFFISFQIQREIVFRRKNLSAQGGGQ